MIKRYATLPKIDGEVCFPEFFRMNEVCLNDGDEALTDAGVINGCALEFVMAPLVGLVVDNWMKTKGLGAHYEPAKNGPLTVTVMHCGRERKFGVAADSTI